MGRAAVAGAGDAWWRWRFGTTLALAMGVGPLVMYALSAVSPQVISEVGLTRAQFGSLATISFTVAAVFSFALGRLVDRVGTRRILLAVFGGAALALGVASSASSMVWLCVAVALSGAVQSLTNPVTNQLISVHVAQARQGLLVGVKQSGVQMAQFLAGATIPPLALVLGWRGATAVSAGVAGLGLLLGYWILPRRPPASSRSTVEAVDSVLPQGVWWLAVYLFLTGASLQATNVYMPLYGYEDLGLSATAAGLSVAVAGGVGLVSRIGWGHLAQRFGSSRYPLAILALVAAAAMGLMVLAGSTGRVELMWAAVFFHGAAAMPAGVIAMLTVIRMVGRASLGKASGILAIGLYLGFAVGPISVGWIVDTRSYAAGWTVAGTVHLLATATIVVWHLQSTRRLRRATP